MYIDLDYLETLGIELIAGQNFRSVFASRSYDGVILNESAARIMGIGTATGQKVHVNWRRGYSLTENRKEALSLNKRGKYLKRTNAPEWKYR